jgi:SAM-dependent methyltransferase
VIGDGHYARKQLRCPSRVVSWSHGSRFDLAVGLAGADPAGRLLDYGCGDGTFVAMAHERFAETRGADAERGQIEDCRERLGHLRGVSFSLTSDLGAADTGRWTVVTCMEVLEHCLDGERRRVIAELARLCAPGGTVIISVPIETGPSLLGKQFVRAVAGWRRLGDYAHRERYSPLEMLRSVIGLPIHRDVHTDVKPAGSFSFHGHKGFDWRIVEREAVARLAIERRLFSPLRWAGPIVNSQAWLICRPRT